MAASGYDLGVQIQIQAPTNANVASVVKQVQRQFSSANVPVNIQVNARALKQASNQIEGIGKNLRNASKNAAIFGDSLGAAARRFGGFAIGTQILGKISSSFSKATKDAIEFEKTLNQIRQITGQTTAELGSLTRTISQLSTSLGANSNDLVNVTKILNQAGFAAADVRKSLEILAKTTLGSSFGTIADTAEGAIAILRQFDRQAQAVGDTSKFLAQSLDAINAVSKRFAVEASDIIAAVRRVGGVFSAAGGEVNELIALFTSIRSTTRESAETISVGLRTIFSRLQRTDTIDALQSLGVTLQDVNGQFVGPLKAIEALSQALSSIDPRDYRISAIVEELGGIRQVGKVIPLIYQYATAQEALRVANASGGSVAADATLAQETLANQFAKTGEAFAELTRKFTNSQGFKEFTKTLLSIANSLIKVADAILPLLPLINKLAAGFLAVKGIGLLGKAAGSIVGKNSGGKIQKFARGGFVPGSGNSDTVPAMLTPGEFVIKKSSVQKLGASTLEAMNNNRYKEGTAQSGIRAKDIVDPSKSFERTLPKINTKAVLSAAGDKDPADKELDLGGAFLQPNDVISRFQAQIKDRKNFFAEIKKGLGFKISDKQISDAIGKDIKSLSVVVNSGSFTADQSEIFQDSLSNAIGNFAKGFAGTIPGIPFSAGKFQSAYQSANIEQTEGNIFEAFIAGLSNAPFDNKQNSNDNFDFAAGLGTAAAAFNLDPNIPADAKRTFSKPALGSLANKGITFLIDGYRAALANALLASDNKLSPTSDIGKARTAAAQSTARSSLRAPSRLAAGGQVDNVPALLTPGEYVINKAAAQKIGYNNLNSMNKTGVARFATGGPVGVQRLAAGGSLAAFTANPATGFPAPAPTPMGSPGSIPGMKDLTKATKDAADAVDDLGDKSKESADKIKDNINKAGDKLSDMGGKLQQVGIALTVGASVILQYSKDMLGLSDATATAAQEAIAFGGIIITAAGSIVQMGAQALTSYIAFKANQLAVQANTQAQIQAAAVTAASSGKNIVASADLAAGIGKASVALTAIVIGAALVGAATKYYESMARQKADETGQAFDDFIEKLREGGADVANARALAASRAEANVESRSTSEAGMAANITAIVSTIIGVIVLAGFTIAGAITLPIAAAVAAITLITTAILSWVGFSVAGAEAQDRYNTELDASREQILKLAEAAAIAADAQFQLADGLKNIDTEANAALSAPGVTEEQRQRIQAQATQEKIGLIGQQSGRIDTGVTTEGFDVLQEIAKKTGQSLAGLTEENIRSNTELSPADQDRAIQAIKAVGEQKAFIDKALAASRQTLQDAAALEIDGTKTYDELVAANGSFAQALNQTKALINQQAALRRAELEAQRKDAYARAQAAAAAGDFEAADQARDQAGRLTQQINAEEKARQDNIDSLEQGYRTSVDLARENRLRAEQEAAFRTAMARTIQQFELMDSVLTTVETSLLRIASASENYVAAITGGDIKFGRQLSENFGDITNTGDRAQFNNELAAVLAPLGQVGQRLFDQINAGANVLENASNVLGNVEFEIGKPVNPTQLLDAMGLNRANLGNAVYDEISTRLREAGEEGGTLSQEQIEEIFGPALEQAKRAAEQAKRINEQNNRNLEIYGNYVNAISAQYDREIAARQKVIDVELQNAEILARAGVRGEVTRQEKETLRTRQAQIGLEGTGVAAGDIQGAATAAADAIAARAAIADRNRQGQATLADVRADAAFKNTIKATTRELERLADQSGKVADLQADIEKEQKKRAAVAGIAEDFVFGGNDTREQINRGLAGVQAALATGTVQNQSEEQRAATLSTLDKLGDIPFFKELKKNIVASDIGRITGNPALAAAIANATPEEQRLQQELINVTQQRTFAAQQLAALEAMKTDELLASEQQLINSLNALKDAIVNENPAQAAQAAQVFPASGGRISGPGTGTSDSIPAQLSDGEYVINARAAKELGYNNLDLMNQGKMPVFAAGGGIIGAAAREVFQVSNTGTLAGFAGTNVGQDGIANTGLDAAIGAGQSIATGGGAAGAATAAVSAYGIHTAVSAGQTAYGLATDYEGTTQAARDKSAKQRGQSTTQNIGENLTNPGQAGLQLAQESVGLAKDRQAAADAQAKTERMEKELRASKVRANSANNPMLTKGARGVNGAYIPEGFSNGGSANGDIPAMLSDGEYVINAAAAKKIGIENLDLMNQGKKPRYAAVGGLSLNELSQPLSQQSPYEREMRRRRNAYQQEMANRAANYNPGLNNQRAIAQTQNRYNARAASFNNSIAQSQMAFRMQAARFVGAGALQGAGGRMLGGGGFGGGGGGQMSQQQTNNMISAANNGGGMQQMNGMTINHNVTVSGMIAIGGLNIQGISAAISQSVGQMVAAEVSKQLKGMNSGFRTGT